MGTMGRAFRKVVSPQIESQRLRCLTWDRTKIRRGARYISSTSLPAQRMVPREGGTYCYLQRWRMVNCGFLRFKWATSVGLKAQRKKPKVSSTVSILPDHKRGSKKMPATRTPENDNGNIEKTTSKGILAIRMLE